MSHDYTICLLKALFIKLSALVGQKSRQTAFLRMKTRKKNFVSNKTNFSELAIEHSKHGMCCLFHNDVAR